MLKYFAQTRPKSLSRLGVFMALEAGTRSVAKLPRGMHKNGIIAKSHLMVPILQIP